MNSYSNLNSNNFSKFFFNIIIDQMKRNIYRYSNYLLLLLNSLLAATLAIYKKSKKILKYKKLLEIS
jgi:hypothetical protein